MAISETLIAIIVVAYIALHYGTLHLTISASIAPFLLLRTDRSTQLGMSFARKTTGILDNGLDRIERIRNVVPEIKLLRLVGIVSLLILLVSFIAVSAVTIRILATGIIVCRHPILSIRSIPDNWWRFVAIIDSTSTIEAIPGVSETQDSDVDEVFHPAAALRLITKELYDFEGRLVALVTVPLYFVLVFLPAFTYRLAVKGTALIYSPLIYIVHGSLGSPIEQLLRDIRDIAIHRAMRIYAAFVLVVFAAKFYLYVSWNQLAENWNAIPGVDIINAYLLPEEVAPWHIASCSIAALTWATFFYVDFVLSRQSRTSGDSAIPLWSGYAIQLVWMFRGILSLYSICCVMYITVSLLPEVEWPPLGSNLCPWPASTN